MNQSERGEKPNFVIHFLEKSTNNRFPWHKKERRGENVVSKMERSDGPYFFSYYFYCWPGCGC